MTQSPLDQQTGRAWWHWPTSARSQSSVKGNGPPPHGTATPASAGLGLIARLHQERAAWFGWLPVVIGLGAATYFQLMIEPSLWLAGLVVLAAVVIHRLSRHAVSFGVAATILLFVAIGFAAAKVRTEWVRGPVLERPLGLVSIEAFVERIEPKPKRGARLTLRPIAIEKLTSDQLPIRIRVRVLNAVQGLHPGSVIRLKARLAPPPPPSHPGSFDFARHAWFQSIGAVGYALARPTIEPFTGVVPWTLQARAGVERVRQSIASRMRAILPNQTGAIAIALVTGERGGISETTNQIYRDAGLFHILSISGMHMAVMAGAVFFVVRFGFAAVPTLALQYPTKKWSAMIAAMAALGYLALSGGAFATVRSYIMISVMFFAILIDRPALALRNVALAAVLILLLFPESILDPGLQMSFAAVAALVSVYEALRASKLGQRMADYGFVRKGVVFFLGIVLSTLVAGLAVAPFAAFHFHNTQHLAVLANLIAMPLSNLIVMPAALGVLTLMPLHLEWPAVVAMGFGIDLMTETARWVAGLPGAVGRVATLPQAAFGLIVMGGLWLVLWHTRWRLFGVALAALGLAIAP
ncbi:MAG: ComEC family competence protein, partial [Alphaproteobacteria bacterium]|nr:ComEC family competence protein [Alphaproteobacteria bacterium]